MGLRQSIEGKSNDISKTIDTVETEEGKEIIRTLLAFQNELLLSLCEHKYIILNYIETIVKNIDDIKTKNKGELNTIHSELEDKYKKRLLPFIEDLVKVLDQNVNTKILSEVVSSDVSRSVNNAISKEEMNNNNQYIQEEQITTSMQYDDRNIYEPQITKILTIFDIVRKEEMFDVKVKEGIKMNYEILDKKQMYLEDKLEKALQDKNEVLMDAIYDVYSDYSVTEEDYEKIVKLKITDAKEHIKNAMGENEVNAINNTMLNIGNMLGPMNTQTGTEMSKVINKIKEVISLHANAVQTDILNEENKDKNVSLEQYFRKLTSGVSEKIASSERSAKVVNELNKDRMYRIFTLLKELILTILRIFLHKDSKVSVEGFLKRIKKIVESVCKYSESQKLM